MMARDPPGGRVARAQDYLTFDFKQIVRPYCTEVLFS